MCRLIAITSSRPRNVTFWPFDEDVILVGEDSYSGGPYDRGVTRRPTGMLSGEPASTACTRAVSAPSRRDGCESERPVERVGSRWGRHPRPALDGAGRPHVDEV